MPNKLHKIRKIRAIWINHIVVVCNFHKVAIDLLNGVLLALKNYKFDLKPSRLADAIARNINKPVSQPAALSNVKVSPRQLLYLIIIIFRLHKRLVALLGGGGSALNELADFYY